MNKKWMALLSGCALSAMLLTGCGGNDDGDVTENDNGTIEDDVNNGVDDMEKDVNDGVNDMDNDNKQNGGTNTDNGGLNDTENQGLNDTTDGNDAGVDNGADSNDTTDTTNNNKNKKSGKAADAEVSLPVFQDLIYLLL